MKYLVVGGLLSNGKANSVFIAAGIEEEPGVKIRGEKWAWNTIAGKPLYLAKEETFLLGAGLAQRMNCRYDESSPGTEESGAYVQSERSFACDSQDFQLSATTEASQVNALNLPAAGIADFHIREFNEKVIYLPLVLAQRLADTERISRFQIYLKDKKFIPAFMQDMERNIRAGGMPLGVVKWIDHSVAASSKGGLEILRIFRALFLSVVAIIAAMTVANSMMKSVNERIREIGALRSFGFRQRDISLLFSMEGLLLGFISCLAGIAVSCVLSLLIEASGLSFNSGIVSTPIPVRVAIAVVPWIRSSLLLMAITLLSAWIVAFRASRMKVADALRYVA